MTGEERNQIYEVIISHMDVVNDCVAFSADVRAKEVERLGRLAKVVLNEK